jgi:hypothetical protein
MSGQAAAGTRRASHDRADLVLEGGGVKGIAHVGAIHACASAPWHLCIRRARFGMDSTPRHVTRARGAVPKSTEVKDSTAGQSPEVAPGDELSAVELVAVGTWFQAAVDTLDLGAFCEDLAASADRLFEVGQARL